MDGRSLLSSRVFRALYLNNFDSVWATLRGMGLPPADAEDLAQEVFTLAFRRMTSVDSRNGVRAWLFATARHLAANLARTNSRRVRKHLALTEHLPLPQSPTVEDSVAVHRALLELDAILNEMSDEKREAFVLGEFGGLGRVELGRALGVNPSTAYSRLRAARREVARRAGSTAASQAAAMLYYDEGRTRKNRLWLALIPVLPPPLHVLSASSTIPALVIATVLTAVAMLFTNCRHLPHSAGGHRAKTEYEAAHASLLRLVSAVPPDPLRALAKPRAKQARRTTMRGTDRQAHTAAPRRYSRHQGGRSWDRSRPHASRRGVGAPAVSTIDPPQTTGKPMPKTPSGAWRRPRLGSRGRRPDATDGHVPGPTAQTCDGVLDCNDECAPADWIGDGHCDVSLDCEHHDFDGHDCEGRAGPDAPEPATPADPDEPEPATPADPDDPEPETPACDPQTQVKDCDGACTSRSRIGDGTCDSMLDCSRLHRDGGDCLDEAESWCISEELECAASAEAQAGSPTHTSCAAFTAELDCNLLTCQWCTSSAIRECHSIHEFPDCQGGCALVASLGDGVCDPALDCGLYDRDNGDCSGA